MQSTFSLQSSAITNFLQQHSEHVTNLAVAHTCYKTYEQDQAGMQHIVARAKRDCTIFRNNLNTKLYGGNKSRRRPLLYQPLILATLEGSLVNTDRDLTLHYNFAIGNLPKGLTDAEFQCIFRECWVVNAKQRDNIWHENVAGNGEAAKGWIGYSLKEMQSKGNIEAWDFVNTQIPYQAFSADLS